MSTNDHRAASHPPFWDERYAANEHLFGAAPNAFVVSAADQISRGSEVLELGAGEGRTLLGLARERGVTGTAVDFSGEALRTGRDWAEREGLPLQTEQADVRTWTPSRRWDAVVVTVLQLLPDERPALYETIRQALRPGGYCWPSGFGRRTYRATTTGWGRARPTGWCPSRRSAWRLRTTSFCGARPWT